VLVCVRVSAKRAKKQQQQQQQYNAVN